MGTKSVLQKDSKSTRSGAHVPNLKTIEMVEDVLAKEKEFSSRNKLSRALPKQVQQQTIEVILEYLERSNKIIRDEEGVIFWISGDNNSKLMKLHKMSTELK